jgi:High potential iron-sulfur protein
MSTTRRRFVEILPLAGAAVWATGCGDKATAPAPAAAPAPAPAAPAPAAAPAPTASTAVVDEKDPVAVTLGYVSDASRADTTKYKTYAAGQNCANCALYTGKAGDATGPCPLFGGRQVAAAGWCGSYAKKA